MPRSQTYLTVALVSVSILASACAVAKPRITRRNKAKENQVLSLAGSGQALWIGGEYPFHHCKLPPDAATVISAYKNNTAINAPIKGQNIEITNEYSSDPELVRLYEQTGATLFMEHAMYRFCEMDANGSFTYCEKAGDSNDCTWHYDAKAAAETFACLVNMAHVVYLIEAIDNADISPIDKNSRLQDVIALSKCSIAPSKNDKPQREPVDQNEKTVTK
jgi:hypothetical protein